MATLRSYGLMKYYHIGKETGLACRLVDYDLRCSDQYWRCAVGTDECRLFQGLCGKSGINRAILIYGITFGIGHIVNLLRGYGFTEMAGQILVSIAVGIVLALLVAVTKNLVPGILFHIIFNISGTITNQENSMQTYLLSAIFAVAVPYSIYLFGLVKGSGEIADNSINTIKH